ncbi:desulfoferrodoxin [Heliobacterium undosum]|uniref:Desulfoferrodoxin n=1 Tax=Heliomicrobium undosum TaxID=121734 RepID=A0A845L492_9FIRM|nr:desulfoferrodoxin family protein [Heliomicrobium undosum]MZP31472.1 desulfoferrodoxin [Heliomicrobium undosum]
MAKNLGIYRCDACGYTLEVVEMGKEQLVCKGHSYALTCSKADAQVVCCGKPMELLEPNTVEASREKHLPVAEFGNDGKFVVKVGSILHPMTAEHLIQWITIVYGDCVQRVKLHDGKAPEANFHVGDANEIDLYGYCNLHGLWKATVKK